MRLRGAVVCTALSASDPGYARGLHECLGPAAPLVLHTLGDPALLSRPLLSLFSSVRALGVAILKTYDLARGPRDAGVPVIGGFHSPMQKECLRLLLRYKQPVMVCPARGLEGMRVPGDWKMPIAEGRLAVVSTLDGKARRTSEETAR